MLPPSRPQLAFIWQDAWTALDQAFSGQASMAANLRLNGLLTDLVFSDVAVRQEKPLSRTQEVLSERVKYEYLNLTYVSTKYLKLGLFLP